MLRASSRAQRVSIIPMPVAEESHPAEAMGPVGSIPEEDATDVPQNSRNSCLTCEVHAQVHALSPADWERLFPGFCNAPAHIQLNERTDTDKFLFRSIVVKEQGHVILYLPLFEMTYNFSDVFSGRVRAFAGAIARWWPESLSLRILGVGFVGGQEGQVGYARDLDLATLQAAWDLALETFDALAQRLNVAVLAFVNFTSESGHWIPMQKLMRFTQMKSLPYCTLPIVYDSFDGYLASLSKSTRKDLRRKLRHAADIEIRRVREPGPWLDTFYPWYLRAVERSEAVFGVKSREYFAQVCRVIPGAEFVLYFHREKLLAFNLVIRTPECLADRYFGMDDDGGSEYALYFISWLENIRYCIAHQIPRYDAGQGSEVTKRRLGSQLVPSLALFRHRNSILHGFLTMLLKQFASHPLVGLPPAQLGLGWEELRTHEFRTRQVVSVNPQYSL